MGVKEEIDKETYIKLFIIALVIVAIVWFVVKKTIKKK